MPVPSPSPFCLILRRQHINYLNILTYKHKKFSLRSNHASIWPSQNRISNLMVRIASLSVLHSATINTWLAKMKYFGQICLRMRRLLTQTLVKLDLTLFQSIRYHKFHVESSLLFKYQLTGLRLPLLTLNRYGFPCLC